MTADSPIHGSAMLMMNSGKILSGSPSLGSWSTYGLGTVNQNLPGYVVMLDKKGGPISGAKNWSSGYMPASYQGTLFKTEGAPILDLAPPANMSGGVQRELIDSIQRANRRHASTRTGNSDLDERIASYELAYGMQTTAAEVGGIKGGSSVGETDEIGSAAVDKPFQVKNLHATVLHQLGLDPNKLSCFYSGLNQKLVGVKHVKPIEECIARVW